MSLATALALASSPLGATLSSMIQFSRIVNNPEANVKIRRRFAAQALAPFRRDELPRRPLLAG